MLPQALRGLGALASTETAREELQQLLRERLLVRTPSAPSRIAEYSARGPLISWVRAAALRMALNLKRDAPKDSAASDDALLEQRAGPDDLELGYIKTRYRPHFRAAFQAALQTLSAQERTVLRMHLLDGLGTDQIGGLYHVHRTTVARWIAQARAKLLDETRRLFAERLQLPRSELTSLIRLLRSQLDVSLGGFLAKQPRAP